MVYEFLCIHMKINDISFYSYHRNKVFEEKYTEKRILDSLDGDQVTQEDLQRLFRSYRAKRRKEV